MWAALSAQDDLFAVHLAFTNLRDSAAGLRSPPVYEEAVRLLILSLDKMSEAYLVLSRGTRAEDADQLSESIDFLSEGVILMGMSNDADGTPVVGPPVMRVLLGGWSAIAGHARLG